MTFSRELGVDVHRMGLLCLLAVTLSGCSLGHSVASAEVERLDDDVPAAACDVLRIAVESQVIVAAIWGVAPDVVSVAPISLEDGAGLVDSLLSQDVLAARLGHDISETLASSFASAVRLRPTLNERCVGESLSALRGLVAVDLQSYDDVRWRATPGGLSVFVQSQRTDMPFSDRLLILLERTDSSGWAVLSTVASESIPCEGGL